MLSESEYNFHVMLKSIRESRGLTQRALGDLMGVDANRISNWEMGIAKPTVDMFRDLCVAINCPPGDLLGLSPTPISSAEYTLLKNFRDGDEHDQELLLAMSENLKKRHQ